MNGRRDLSGNPIKDSALTTACAECGMPLTSFAEFHPWEACEAYKATHDSREVHKAIAHLSPGRILGGGAS